MCRATIEFISPADVPVTLQITPADEQQTIIDILERAEKIGAYFRDRGWRFAQSEPDALSAIAGPTFAGYPCSPTVDDRGLPTWIIVDGAQAQRREKQGDVWYSVKVDEDAYIQVLRIPKGEQVPPVAGLRPG
ncbi:MAG: hypothetical protein H6642_11155 [Caldilineaceae bacterium]|nr:hypothetical protein [Caldilineaceae bacterium]